MQREYKQSTANSLLAKYYLFMGVFPYKESLIGIKFGKERKIPSLLGLMYEHHPDSLSHIFEVSYIATKLAISYFSDLKTKLNFTTKQYQDVFIPLIEGVFKGSLLHDIGKIGVPVKILDRAGALTKKERHLLHLHGQMGREIMEIVGLGKFAYFGSEHHLGNSQNNGWTEKDLKLRHSLTEFTSIADLIAGSLDPRRKYHDPEELKTLLETINEKCQSGIFSKGLIAAFSRTIVRDKQYPPYGMDTFLKDVDIMNLFNKFGITDILIKNMSKQTN